MSLADFVLDCHAVLEGMSSENQQQQPRMSQKAGSCWTDMRLGNALRVCRSDGRSFGKHQFKEVPMLPMQCA